MHAPERFKLKSVILNSKVPNYIVSGPYIIYSLRPIKNVVISL